MEENKASRRKFVKNLCQATAVTMVLPVLTHCEYKNLTDFINSSIELIYPVGGESFFTNESILIQWKSMEVNFIDIDFSTDNGKTFKQLLTQIPASEKETLLELPEVPSDFCKIRIRDAEKSGVFSLLSASFSLKGLITIKVNDFSEISNAGDFKIFDHSYLGKYTVLKTGDEAYSVFSLICTHQGCTVDWFDNTNKYKCICHGSEFSKEGGLLQGPAARDLDLFTTEFDSDNAILKIFYS